MKKLSFFSIPRNKTRKEKRGNKKLEKEAEKTGKDSWILEIPTL